MILPDLINYRAALTLPLDAPRHSYVTPLIPNQPPIWLSPATKTASTMLKHISTCHHKFQGPQLVPTSSKAPTPVGSPSRTAPPLPTHPFSTLSNPPKSTATLPALHALLEEPMSNFTTQKTRRDATDSGHARGASRMTRPLLERRRRLSQGR